MGAGTTGPQLHFCSLPWAVSPRRLDFCLLGLAVNSTPSRPVQALGLSPGLPATLKSLPPLQEASFCLKAPTCSCLSFQSQAALLCFLFPWNQSWKINWSMACVLQLMKLKGIEGSRSHSQQGQSHALKQTVRAAS